MELDQVMALRCSQIPLWLLSSAPVVEMDIPHLTPT